jgi:hypothetical protein
MTLQRKGTQPSTVNSHPSEAPSIVHEVLRSPGQLLDSGTRAFMEPRFGHDFGRVRVQSLASHPITSGLTVGPPGDRFEQEADKNAEKVLRDKSAPPPTGKGKGFDFSQVCVHTDREAAESAWALGSRAYTVGQHIVFGEGQYRPESVDGRRLLAHELTHVAQQAQFNGRIQREALHLYDSSDNFARRWGYAHHYCDNYDVLSAQCVRHKPGNISTGVGSLSDVTSSISTTHGRGHTLNQLFFHTHGAPGYVHLPNGGIDSTNASSLRSASGDIAGSADVGFLGCNVAEGPAGDAFLLAAGSALLGTGGGRVYGSDSVTFSVPGLGQRRPIWSSQKVVCVTPGGSARSC